MTAPKRPWWRLLRVAWLIVASPVVLGVLLWFVFPSRTYLDQRRQLAAAAAHVHVLADQNAQLSAQVEQLHTDAEIERLAREQYHLVMPGEQAYAILPAPLPTTTTTVVAAARPAAAVHSRSWAASLWQRLTAWF